MVIFNLRSGEQFGARVHNTYGHIYLHLHWNMFSEHMFYIRQMAEL